MKDIRYYHTTTDNAQVLRLIDGVMQVFEFQKRTRLLILIGW